MITRRQALLGATAAALASHWRLGSAGAAADTSSGTTFLPSPSSPLVALRLVFRVGSQDDPPGKEGLAALTAAMVAEGGTKELTYDQVLERFYPMSASLEGACRKEAS